MNALHYVALNDISALRTLCTKSNSGAYNLEEVDEYGNTALLKACYLGRSRCVTILISFGASLLAINYFGQNALTLATYTGNYNIIIELLRYRSYTDFNKSSIVPALCIATLQQNHYLIGFFKALEVSNGHDIITCHGINAYDLDAMIKVRPKIAKNCSFTK